MVGKKTPDLNTNVLIHSSQNDWTVTLKVQITSQESLGAKSSDLQAGQALFWELLKL